MGEAPRRGSAEAQIMDERDDDEKSIDEIEERLRELLGDEPAIPPSRIEEPPNEEPPPTEPTENG